MADYIKRPLKVNINTINQMPISHRESPVMDLVHDKGLVQYMQKRSGHASAVVAEKTEATRFENVIGLLRSVN